MVIINKETNKSYSLNPNHKIAFDGCHKIYICENDEDLAEAKECGYKIHELDELKTLFEKSCSLKFIYNWSLTKFYVEQFEDAKFIQ